MEFKSRVRCRALVRAALGLAFLLTAAVGVGAAPLVLPGWDLLHTLPGTQFMGVPFLGVPAGSYDFGNGLTGVGNADTIVRRLTAAGAPSGVVPIEIVALGLVSAAPVDFGAGTDFHYITLQSVRGGPASTGEMTINFGPEGAPHGAFDSFFDVFFDLRIGAADGPILMSDSLILQALGAPWGHLPSPGAVQIPGVNVLLNGRDRQNDFFPIGPVVHQHPAGLGTHIVEPAPEPATFTLVGLGLLAVIRQRRASPQVRTRGGCRS
jgi:hypothetical protein